MDAIFEVLTKDSQPIEIDSIGHTLYAMDGNKDLLHNAQPISVNYLQLHSNFLHSLASLI